MAKRQPTEKALYDLLIAKYDAAIADAFFESINDIKSQADLGRLIEAIQNNNIEEAFTALHMTREAFDPLAEAMRSGYNDAGMLATRFMPPMVSPDGNTNIIRFSVRNPVAENWLLDHSSTRVTDIINDQRVTIRQALMAGMNVGENPTETAIDIVGRYNKTTGRREGGVIGLTANQESFVRNAREELLLGDPANLKHYLTRTMRDHRLDHLVHKAIETGQPIKPEDRTKIEDRYRSRLLKLRGDTIGRTESLTAMRAGKFESYRQAIETGGLKPDRVRKIWHTAHDERVRDSHEALDGESISMDKPFKTAGGSLMMYPGDTALGAGAEEIINCRCDAEYRVDFLANIGDEAPNETKTPEFTPEVVIPPELSAFSLRQWELNDPLVVQLNEARAKLTAAGLSVPNEAQMKGLYKYLQRWGIDAMPPNAVNMKHIDGIIDGWNKFKEVAAGNSALQQAAQNISKYPVSLIDSPSTKYKMLMAVAHNGPDRWIPMNQSAADSLQDMPVAAKSFERKNFLVAARHSDTAQEQMKWSMIHELGHVVDLEYNWTMSRGLVAELLTNPLTKDDPIAYLKYKVSGYAATNPQEAWAETFTKLLAGENNPPFDLDRITGQGVSYYSSGKKQGAERDWWQIKEEVK